MSANPSNEQHPPRVTTFGPLSVPLNGPSGGGSGGNSSVNSTTGNMGGNVQGQMTGILSPASALEHYRLSQLYQYAMAAERLRCPPGSFMPPMPPGIRPELAPLFYGPYCRIDPRLAGLCRPPEEPKPQHSYIGLIAMAILSSSDKKLVLSDIYQYILDNFPYFRGRSAGWRNSMHNLSLNDCFIKAGRSANGKGHYWAIHPANVDDFTKGDFRRRRAQRKVRKHMGLAVDDEDSPSPPPASPPPVWAHPHHPLNHSGGQLGSSMNLTCSPQSNGLDIPATLFGLSAAAAAANLGQKTSFQSVNQSLILSRKRQFDVASLLAPEKEGANRDQLSPNSCKSDDNDRDQSLSSSSPPPTLIKRSNNSLVRKKTGDSSDSDHSENEDIEVTEEDTPKGEVEMRSDMKNTDSKDDNDFASEMHNVHKHQRLSLGQDGTSSNDEDQDDSFFRNNSPIKYPHLNGSQSLRGPMITAQNFQGQLNHEVSMSQSNLPHGVMSPLDFIQAQHFLQQHQGGGGGGGCHNPNPNSPLVQSQNSPSFPFGPGSQHLLQQNPSLASLMILSSRYRELTSNMIMASRRSPQ